MSPMTGLLALVLISPTALTDVPPAHELRVWELHQIAGDETLENLRATEDGRRFLAAIEGHGEWLHELLDSGPVQNGQVVVEFLHDRWQDDPSLADHDVHRSMATACALAMGMRERDPQWMADRYEWFRDNWNAELLNAGYGDLSTFERRFLARGLQWAGSTDVATLEHLRERICLPRQQYAKAAWRAPYRGHNAFGDSVQGPMYYMPFQGVWDSRAEMSIEVGGVCGALSHLGAAAAIASGIPALTMGEPGHCAYAVQTEPHTWKPAYSLSWKRGLHTTMTRNTWPSLEMSQRAANDLDAARAAGDLRRAALWHEAHDQPLQADEAWRRAIERNPLDEHLWIGYALFGARGEPSDVWWRRLQQDVRDALLPSHPEPAWFLLKQHVYPTLLDGATEARQRAACLAFLDDLEGWGPVRWNVEEAFNWGWNRSSTSEDQRALLEAMVPLMIDDGSVGPAFVAWAQAKTEESPEVAAAFEDVLLAHAGADGGGDGRQAVLRKMASSMLPVAAAEGDLDTFQRIGRAAAVLYEPKPTLAEAGIEPFPGELLSSGGAISIFKPANRWDSPEKHWGVLEERGGWFHTDNGEQPWFEVELPGFGHLSGVILETRRGHPARAKGVRVLVSEDGEHWTQVGETPDGSTVARIDLSESRPRARFVRFERDGRCMHYARVLIFGERAS